MPRGVTDSIVGFEPTGGGLNPPGAAIRSRASSNATAGPHFEGPVGAMGGAPQARRVLARAVAAFGCVRYLARTLSTMSRESKTAFYKATKFWTVFLLALCLAAAMWKLLGANLG